MKSIELSHFSQLVGGELNARGEFTGFALDSGSVSPGDLFLAIKGSRVDGHDFVDDAIRSGAVAALVERPVNAPHILVSNLVEALALFGRSIRDGFSGPVAGITGSAGKTTTKEFVAAALSSRGAVLKTEGNRNTEFTSPLIWAELEGQWSAVIEMAMRGFGQIDHLSAIARPTVSVITNIGYSHLEQVGSREGIARAKCEIINGTIQGGPIVAWAEDDFIEHIVEQAKDRPVRTFGTSERADCRIASYRAINWDASMVTGTLNNVQWEATLPVVGRHIALNAAAAILAASLCGVDIAAAAIQLQSATIPPMRMEWIERNGVRILMDNYNASPPAMLAAIETLSAVPSKGRRLAVLGEMKELGDYTASAHRSVGRAVAEYDLDEVLLFGEPTGFVLDEAIAHGFDANRLRHASSIADVRSFIESAKPGDVVLVKGSRALELESALLD